MRILESQSQRLTSWLTLGKWLHHSGLSFLYKKNEDNRLAFRSAVRIGWEPCMEQGLNKAAGQHNPTWVSLYSVDPGCLAGWYLSLSLEMGGSVFVVTRTVVASGFWGRGQGGLNPAMGMAYTARHRKPCLHLLKVSTRQLITNKINNTSIFP